MNQAVSLNIKRSLYRVLPRHHHEDAAQEAEFAVHQAAQKDQPASSAIRGAIIDYARRNLRSRSGQQREFLELKAAKSEKFSCKPIRAGLPSDWDAGLSEQHRLVIHLLYFRGLSQCEAGAVLSVSAGRVSQLHREVLECIRRRGKQ